MADFLQLNIEALCSTVVGASEHLLDFYFVVADIQRSVFGD